MAIKISAQVSVIFHSLTKIMAEIVTDFIESIKISSESLYTLMAEYRGGLAVWL